MNFFHAVNASVATQQTASFVTANLEARWDFGDTSCYPGSGNTIYDLTSNNIDLTRSGATFTDSHYFAFDGANDSMKLSNVPSAIQFDGTDAFSVGIWLKNQEPANGDFGVYFNTNQNYGDYDGYSIITGVGGERNKFRFWLRKDSSNNMRVTPDVSFNVGDWYYIVSTYDGSQSASGMTLYSNGVELTITDTVDLGTITNVNYSGNKTCIGVRDVTGYAKCGIGDVHVYSSELTASEVLANYNATKSTYGL